VKEEAGEVTGFDLGCTTSLQWHVAKEFAEIMISWSRVVVLFF
jgi:hypothetical protein